MENEKYIIACISEVKPSILICDYSSWVSKKTKNNLKLLHTIDHQNIDGSTDLSGNLELGESEELLSELVTLEYEQSKVLQQKAKLTLEAVKRRAKKNGIPDPKICLRHGSLTENLLDLKDNTEVVVIGRYGEAKQKSKKYSIGHKVESAIRSVEKPILIVSKAFEEPTSILLAYDGSEGSSKALNYIINSKIFLGLEIHVVYVGEKTEKSNAFIKDAVTKLEALNYSVKQEQLLGVTNEVLLNYIDQNKISMMVMGAFGKHWLRELLIGSFTSKMLALSEKPLFLVR